MGRPPLGKVAMSGAMRMRRYRQRNAKPTQHLEDALGTANIEIEYYQRSVVELLRMLAKAGVTPADCIAQLEAQGEAGRQSDQRGRLW